MGGLKFCRIFICEGHQKPGLVETEGIRRVGQIVCSLGFETEPSADLGSAKGSGRALDAHLCHNHSSSVLPIPYIVLLGKIFFFFGHAMQHAGSSFPDQGSNLCPLQWKHGVLTTGLPGKFPRHFFFFVPETFVL